MPETKYAELQKLESLRPLLEGLAVTFRTTSDGPIALDEVVRSARMNFYRVLDLAVLPKEVFWKGFWYQMMAMAVDQRSKDRWNELIAAAPGSSSSAEKPAPWEQDRAEIIAELQTWYRNLGPDPSLGYELIDQAFDDKYEAGAYSLMAAIITGSWTAFEVLSGDLWEAAVNEKPATLLSTMAKSGKGYGGQVRKVQLNLAVDDLREFGYNLSGRLGTLFRNEKNGEFSFATFDRISDSYKKAFDRPFDMLDSKKDRSVFDLAKTRNCIVHKAATVDEQFEESMVETAARPQFSGLELGQRLPIDGDLVQSLVDGVIRASIALITEIDVWLTQAKG